jgi:hypothetical protein
VAIAFSNLTTGNSITDATSYNTASITPTANALVLVSVIARQVANPAVTPSLSGCGLTWTVVESCNYGLAAGSLLRRHTVFAGRGGSPSTGALTIDFGTDTQARIAWSVDQATGVAPGDALAAIAQSEINSQEDPAGDLTVNLGAFLHASNATFLSGSIASASVSLTVDAGYASLGAVQANEIPGINLLTQWINSNDTTPTLDQGGTAAIGAVAMEIRSAVPSISELSRPRTPMALLAR